MPFPRKLVQRNPVFRAKLDDFAGHQDRKARSTFLRLFPTRLTAPFTAFFDLLTVQRKLKDAGRFVFIDQVKKNPSFLRHIPSSLKYVRDALARRPDLAEVRAILAKHVPELR